MKAFDEIKTKQNSGVSIGMEIREKEEFIKVAGHVFLKIEDKSGEVQQIDLGHNFIVFEARLLIAQLMKFNFANGDPIVNGVTHLAVGTGGPYQIGRQVKPFDLQNPPIPGVDIYNENKAGSYDINGDGLSDLINEVSRKQVKAHYVDANGNVAVNRTNIVDFAATFDYEDANGPLVEMAIFGGVNAEQARRGTMVAVKTFPVINKTINARMTFAWRLAF